MKGKMDDKGSETVSRKEKTKKSNKGKKIKGSQIFGLRTPSGRNLLETFNTPPEKPGQTTNPPASPRRLPPADERKAGFQRGKKGSLNNLMGNVGGFFIRSSGVNTRASQKEGEESEKEKEVIEENSNKKNEVPQQPSENKENTPAIPAASPSLKLLELINEKKCVEIYRHTIHAPETVEKNKEKLNQFKNYPIHTKASLTTIVSLMAQIKLEEIALKQIELLNNICNDILEPVFINYLKEEGSQAEAMCEYIKQAIIAATDLRPIKEYPLFAKQLTLKDKKFYLAEAFRLSQNVIEKEYFEEITLRTKTQLRRWRFIEGERDDAPFNQVFPYFRENIELIKYKTQIEALHEITTKLFIESENAGRCSHEVQDLLEVEATPKGFITFSSQLPLDKQTQQTIIEKLGNHFNTMQVENAKKDSPRREEESPVNFPPCYKETEFYFMAGSPVLSTIQQIVSDFIKENKKLYKVEEGVNTPRNREDFATRLVNMLKDELLPTLKRETSRSYCL